MDTNDWILVIAYVLFIVFLFSNTQECNAAEAILPIKLEIVRCVSLDETDNQCMTNDLCCEILENKLLDKCMEISYDPNTGETTYYCGDTDKEYTINGK